MGRPLKKGELAVRDAYIGELSTFPPRNKKQLLLAAIGLSGAGKTAAMRWAAAYLEATLVSLEDVCVALRKANQDYDSAPSIMAAAAQDILRRGGSAVLDADYIDSKKRKILRTIGRTENVRAEFIRVHCNFEVLIRRALGRDNPGARIKQILEGLPAHYKWELRQGGGWTLRPLTFSPFLTLNTTEPKEWKPTLEEYLKILLY